MTEPKAPFAPLPLEDLFEQATEDVSTYLWAVSAWREPPVGYERGYLMLRALSSRSRARTALAASGKDLPSDFARGRTRLRELWDQAESRLLELLHTDQEQLGAIVSHEFQMRVEELDALLGRIKALAESVDASAPDIWGSEELKGISSDFLLRFQDLSLAIEELETLEGPASQRVPRLRDNLRALEARLRTSFECFLEAGPWIEKLAAREYGVDRWWLKPQPRSDSSGVLETLRRAFRRWGEPPGLHPCPADQEERTIALALGELGSEESQSARSHLFDCRECMSLFLDTREAASTQPLPKNRESTSRSEELGKGQLQSKTSKATKRLVQEVAGRERFPKTDTSWENALYYVSYRKFAADFEAVAPELVLQTWENMSGLALERPDVVDSILRASPRVEVYLQEGKQEKTVVARVVLSAGGKLKDLRLVSVPATEHLENGYLTITGSLPPDLRAAPCRCSWVEPAGLAREPSLFDIDATKGTFVATFRADVRPAGELRLVVLITSKTADSSSTG